MCLQSSGDTVTASSLEMVVSALVNPLFFVNLRELKE